MKRTSKLAQPNALVRRYAKTIQLHKDTLSHRYKVKEIGIFGSVVRGTQRKRSDIDILVDFNVVPDLLTFIEIEGYLENLLKRKVDLIDKRGIRPELRQQILSETVYV